MSLKARLYISFVVLAGATVLIGALTDWQSKDAAFYLCYLSFAVLASRLKVNLPSVTTGMSIFFIYVLFGILEFSLPETLFLGCAATLLQCFSRDRSRPRLQHVLFNVCNMALAISIAYSVYHSATLQERHVGPAMMFLMATGVFFAMVTFPVAAVIALAEDRSLRRIWREGYFWSFPYYLFGAALAGVIALLNHKAGWQTGLLVVPIVYLAYRSYGLYMGTMTDGKKRAEEMASLHLRTIEALALAIEAKDQTTHDHLRRVQVYALEVGKELGLSQPELDALQAAALLHDVGKLAIPEHIISKPGKLTREEFEKMKIHTVVGAEILERVRFPYPVTPIVRSHHEKWNGSGYPDGLKGEAIPIGARILAAVDCLDALASERQYRRAVNFDDAVRRVVSESGLSFDPRVVAALQKRCSDLEKLALESLKESACSPADLKVHREIESAPVLDGGTHEDPAHFLSSISAATQEAQALLELAQDLGNSLSLNETLALAAQRLKRMIPYHSLTIYVSKGGTLRPEYVAGENLRLFSTLEIPFGQGLSGWVAENRKPIVNGDPALEPGYVSEGAKFTPMQSALSVPLVGLTDSVSVLTLYHEEKEAFANDHLRIALAIAPKIALAIENALKYQQAENSAATDYMTGLPNARSLFLHLDSELARCRRTAAPVVVMVCDMNGFKQVNDRFGHLEGNRLLHAVGAKLKESCREYDYVARMGGDEFVLVLPGLTLDQVKPKVLRLKAITKEAGQEICNVDTLSLSVGHALYPLDGTDAEQLLSEADKRMYAVKQREKMRLVEPRGYDFDRMLAR